MKRTNTVGCCGIECGLCPRFHGGGSTRCPGCAGEGFENVHPSCGFITCCVKKHGLEVCGECGDYPCPRFDRETGEADSFVTHRNVRSNQAFIGEHGVQAFLELQERRRRILEELLSRFDEGRSKSFYCLASALLSLSSLEAVIGEARSRGTDPGFTGAVAAKTVRELLSARAEAEHVELRLRKPEA